MPKIMLIEDDRTMLSLLTILLQMENFDVCSPSDDRPEDILAAIRQEKPDVVLLDVNLRLGNGIDLLGKMRSEEELKYTRVIMSSGMDLNQECLQAGADGFLMKPYMPDELIRLIKETPGNE